VLKPVLLNKFSYLADAMARQASPKNWPSEIIFQAVTNLTTFPNSGRSGTRKRDSADRPGMEE
jgi:hypothetical protein